MVERGLMVLQGRELYPDASQGGPYLFTAYPPLFFTLQAALMKVFGGLWWPGRALSLLGYLGCGLALLGWGWKRWGALWALALTLLFWLSPTWALWGSMARPDVLMLFLNFSAFLLLYGQSLKEKGEAPRGFHARLAAAGLLNGAALLLKQNAFSLTLAYAAYGLWKKERINLSRFLAFSLVPLGVVCVFETWKTGGFFLKMTGPWLDTGFDGKLWAGNFRSFLGEDGWLILAVLVTLVLRRVRPLLIFQIGFSGLQLLGLGRLGGAENYWLESWIYGLFLVAEGWRADFKEPGTVLGRSGRWGLVLLLFWGYETLTDKKWPEVPSPEVVAMKTEAAKIYREPGEHLALDLDLPVMAGKKIWLQPVEYGYMVRKGRWSLQPLLAEIRARKFTTVELYDIPRQYLLSQEAVDEVEKNYQVVLRAYGRKWYRPKP